MAFEGFPPQMAEFFMQIRFNNNQAFFNEHRAAYERHVKAPLHALAGDLAPVIHEIDPALETRPGKVTSRIRRDTRFARDKSPYRDHMWIGWRATHLPEEKQATPGLYAGFYADRWEAGCGYYEATPATMKAFRERLAAAPSPFLSVAGEKGLAAEYALLGEDYKRPPQGIDRVPKALRPWYAKKGFYLHRDAPYPEDTRELLPELERLLRLLGPFYRYLAALG